MGGKLMVGRRVLATVVALADAGAVRGHQMSVQRKALQKDWCRVRKAGVNVMITILADCDQFSWEKMAIF
jgi:hypothetical protein